VQLELESAPQNGALGEYPISCVSESGGSNM
jgi:hypothetical protein